METNKVDNTNTDNKSENNKKNEKKEVCVELQNIQYQTMLKNSKTQNHKPKCSNIDNFLLKEKKFNTKQQWSKLSINIKRDKLIEYIDEYGKNNKLNDTSKDKLTTYLLYSLKRKKLQRIKDVIYDIDKGIIVSIPGLSFNKTTNKYTIKNNDKKNISTLSSLSTRKKKKKRNKSDKDKKKDKKKRKDKKKISIKKK